MTPPSGATISPTPRGLVLVAPSTSVAIVPNGPSFKRVLLEDLVRSLQGVRGDVDLELVGDLLVHNELGPRDRDVDPGLLPRGDAHEELPQLLADRREVGSVRDER